MAQFLEYNPLRGTWKEYDRDPLTGVEGVTTKQDLQPVVDYCAEARASGVNDKVGDFSHYAVIPAWLQVELMAKGLKFGRQEDTHRLIKEIETNYPRFKVTNLRHHVRGT